MKRIIGIDLGTTNTVAAFYDGDSPSIIPNERGRHLTPSVVAVTESGELLVGEAAKNQAMVNTQGTVHSVKRLMGKDMQISLRDKSFSPQEIAAFILKKVRRDSEKYLGEEIQNAVISVPAYFNEPQRRATREAGHLAGLKVIKILNEPTAASLAYASQIKEKKNILVYDIGGGTFDATVLSSDGTNFRVLATSGDNHLGGVDFDELLLQRVLEKFSAQTNIELGKEPFLMQQLLEQVEKAKIELSSRQEAIIALPFIGTNGVPVHLQHKITRQDLNDLIKPYIEQTIELSREAVKDAGVSIDALIFSGGTSRIPLIGKYMEDLLDSKPVVKINPDEVVALGTAVQAAIISDEKRGMTLHDVTPLPLGVEIEGGRFLPILEKNSPIPTERKRFFTTVSDSQNIVEVHVLQGLGDTAAENVSLGKFSLSGIKRSKQGDPKIELRFKVDENGILKVVARDLDTGAMENVTIRQKRPDADSSTPEETKQKLSNLLQRTEGMLNELSGTVEAEFKREVETILKGAQAADKKNEPEKLEEYRVALGAVLAELETLVADQEVEYGRA